MKTLYRLSHQIDEFAEEIDERNRKSFVSFSTGALLLSAIVFLATIFIPLYRPLLLSHGFMLLYSSVLFFLSRWCQQSRIRKIRLCMYLALTPLLAGAVLVGTYFDPKKPAIAIFIYLCIFPLFIIDKPWHIIAYQIFFCLFFILMSYFSKSPELFQDNIQYLPIYLSLDILANIFTLIDRTESAKNYVLLQHESERDSLTQLLNRRSGEERLYALFRSQVHGTFAIIDIDDFKHFNDRYGHQIGDEVLSGLSQAMISVFRASDVTWRLGGDEFAIFAANMLDADTCLRRFTVFQKRVSEIKLPDQVKEPISVSIGCTLCLSEHLDFNEVYSSSDAALYKAKKMGRGKTVISSVSL